MTNKITNNYSDGTANETIPRVHNDSEPESTIESKIKSIGYVTDVATEPAIAPINSKNYNFF